MEDMTSKKTEDPKSKTVELGVIDFEELFRQAELEIDAMVNKEKEALSEARSLYNTVKLDKLNAEELHRQAQEETQVSSTCEEAEKSSLYNTVKLDKLNAEELHRQAQEETQVSSTCEEAEKSSLYNTVKLDKLNAEELYRQAQEETQVSSTCDAGKAKEFSLYNTVKLDKLNAEELYRQAQEETGITAEKTDIKKSSEGKEEPSKTPLPQDTVTEKTTVNLKGKVIDLQGVKMVMSTFKEFMSGEFNGEAVNRLYKWFTEESGEKDEPLRQIARTALYIAGMPVEKNIKPHKFTAGIPDYIAKRMSTLNKF